MSEALIIAAKSRNLEGIKACLAAGANINFYDNNEDKDDRTALIWAASLGFTEIVKHLIAENATIQYRSKKHNETAFLAAVKYGQISALEVLFQTKKIPPTELEEAIFTAIGTGNLEVLQYLCSSLKIKYDARVKPPAP